MSLLQVLKIGKTCSIQFYEVYIVYCVLYHYSPLQRFVLCVLAKTPLLKVSATEMTAVNKPR